MEIYLDLDQDQTEMQPKRRRGQETEMWESTPLQNGNRDSSSSRPQKTILEEWRNILLLFFLYILQGIPIGLAASIPMILQHRNVSYKQQALFSLVFWPFSLKLLWAPIVDSCFWPSMGRRKSWLIPTQYLLGFLMVIYSNVVKELLGSENVEPCVGILTAMFFVLYFLAATQDIAVDGWALTILARENVGYASTCNSVGQTAGYFLGNVVFLALESADFCNKYLRDEPLKEGLVTLPGFLYFWGVVFITTTTLVWMLKHEPNTEEVDELGVRETYKQLVQVMLLPSVQTFMIVLLTVKVGFSAADSVTGLKLIEAGVPKDRLALLAIPLVPLQIILPLIISRVTAGPRPMDTYVKAIPYRLVFGLGLTAMVYLTPMMKLSTGEFPLYYYALLVLVYAVHQVTLYSMFVAGMAMYARVSDPAIGGTYMTLLNTLSNLGGNWPSTLALWMVDPLTFKSCVGEQAANNLSCNTDDLKKECTAAGGSCVTNIDGYYIESVICLVIGLLWLRWGSRKIRYLQSLPERAWKVSRAAVS